MKKLTLALPVLFILAGVVACNSDPAPQLLPPSPTVVPLDGLSTREVIKTKYDKLELNCELDFSITNRERVGSGIFETPITGQGNASWDLLRDFNEQKSLELRAEADGAAIEMNIDVNQIQIADSNVNGVELDESPVLSANFTYKSDHSLSPHADPGMIAIPSGSGSVQFFEGIPNTIINTSGSMDSPDGTGMNHSIQATCTLNAVAKNGYDHHRR